MIAGALVVLAVIAWTIKQIVGPLIGQQARGSVPDYTAAKARAAAKLLPPDLAEKYEQDWLAELDGLADKPLSAIGYARGLRRGARRIALQTPGVEQRHWLSRSGSSRRRLPERNFLEKVRLFLQASIFVLVLLVLLVTMAVVPKLVHGTLFGSSLFLQAVSGLLGLGLVLLFIGTCIVAIASLIISWTDAEDAEEKL